MTVVLHASVLGLASFCPGNLLGADLPNQKKGSSASPPVNLGTDYQTLTHSLALKAFRAGKHAKDDLEEYFVDVKIIGLVDTDEEDLKKLEERKRAVHDGGRFGEISVKPLSYWLPSEKERNAQVLKISGDAMRAVIGETMHKFAISEQKVLVVVQVALYKQDQWLPFLGKDLKIGEQLIYPQARRPSMKSFRPAGEFKIEDTQGTGALIDVRYSELDVEKTEKPAAAIAAPVAQAGAQQSGKN